MAVSSRPEPAPARSTWVIAVRRDHRDRIPREWVESVRQVPDLVVLGAASPARIQVAASAEAIAAVRERFGDSLRIEAVIEHAPATTPAA